MKKHGFTLAELLIVLGIAGVVAAVILPAINGLMPDKTKINYLKVYDELGKNIKALTSDSSIFPVLLKEGSTDIDVSRYPLVNNSQPLKAPFKDDTKYSGDNKLCNLLAHTFGADSCSTTSYPDKSSFTTSNGMEWWISQTKREVDTAENKISYQTDIYVDVDSSKKSSNCMYGEDGCKNPDRFKFLLAADGRLVPADPVGVHYINTRKNLLKKKFEAEGDVLASLDDDLLNNNYHSSEDNVQDNTTVDDSTGSGDSGGSTVKPQEPIRFTSSGLPTCGQAFKNPSLKTSISHKGLTIQCFDNDRLFIGTGIQHSTSPDQLNYDYYIWRVLKAASRRLFWVDITVENSFFSEDRMLSRPASTDVKIYFDVFALQLLKYYAQNNSYKSVCYINNKYKDKYASLSDSDKFSFCRGTDKIVYVTDWEKPVGYVTIPTDPHSVGNNPVMISPLDAKLLFNPFEVDKSLSPEFLEPGFEQNNTLSPPYKTTPRIFFRYSHATPRKEENNTYYAVTDSMTTSIRMYGE